MTTSFEGFIDYIKNNHVSENVNAHTEEIKNYRGKIIAVIDYKPNGDQEIKNYRGMILGVYSSSQNVTKDYRGKILSTGNTLTMLLKDTK